MEIEFDSTKRAETLEHRGLDFAKAPEVFAGVTFTREDDRADYGETASSPWAFSTTGWWSWSGLSAERSGASSA